MVITNENWKQAVEICANSRCPNCGQSLDIFHYVGSGLWAVGCPVCPEPKHEPIHRGAAIAAELGVAVDN